MWGNVSTEVEYESFLLEYYAVVLCKLAVLAKKVLRRFSTKILKQLKIFSTRRKSFF